MQTTSNNYLSCKEAVAFEMMKVIGEADTASMNEKISNPKKYTFDLYRECLKVVSGENHAE